MRGFFCALFLILAASVLVSLSGFGSVSEHPPAPPGSTQLAGAFAGDCRYLLDEDQHAAVDRIHRTLREAEARLGRASDPEVEKQARQERDAAAAKLMDLLDAWDMAVPIYTDGSRGTDDHQATLPGDTGAIFFKIYGGKEDTRCVTVEHDLSTEGKSEPGSKVTVEVGGGVTWALVRLRNVPAHRTTLWLEFKKEGQEHLVSVDVTTLAKGRLRVKILSAENGKPTAAMVRLVWNVDGRDRMPAGAIEFAPQFDYHEGRGRATGRRNANLPGRLGGAYWCVPGPFDMALPPGEWKIVIRRGLEHLPVFDQFAVGSGETVEKTYEVRRWVDMPDRGWWSGDDHVHCRILSEHDARQLMTWVEAEDVHLSNVVEMGDINRTWFEQLGFGPEFRVRDGEYILSPGQECPRTHGELGHTISMNARGMVRDTDRYFLYDWVFDNVHAQGGISGYAHVNSGLFHVHRDMSINIPKEKVDFVEILQFGQLGTDLFYDFLNTGFEMTASAGSDVPWGGTVGEVRLYAYLGDEPFSADAWFRAVERGRTFVTNGPMLEIRVDDALPGDSIRTRENRRLSIKARAWGHPERMVPTKLEVVRHGEVISSSHNPDGEKTELKLELEAQVENGYWIAARAQGSDGSHAHSTPIYVMREPLRFWKYDAVPELLEARLASLKEVEEMVAAAQKMKEEGKVEGNRTLDQLAQQGPRLLERVAGARKIYAELKETAEKERTLRR